MFSGRILEDSATLLESGIQFNSLLDESLALIGGKPRVTRRGTAAREEQLADFKFSEDNPAGPPLAETPFLRQVQDLKLADEQQDTKTASFLTQAVCTMAPIMLTIRSLVAISMRISLISAKSLRQRRRRLREKRVSMRSQRIRSPLDGIINRSF